MIGFIILHYIVEDETKKCVDSILNLNGNKKIVIVDNCSPNESLIGLKKYYQNNCDVDIIKNVSNNGFSKGNNYGYQYLLNKYSNIDFVVIMNNDMEIKQNDFISKIYDIYSRKKFFVLGPDIYSTSKKIHQNPEVRTIRTVEKIDKELIRLKKITKSKLIIKSVLRKIPFMKLCVQKIKKIKMVNNDYEHEQINTTLHGSCLIFSKLFIEKRKKAFFDKTKFYCEAQILDYECQKNNWMRIYSPELKVLHHEDIATNASYNSYVKRSLFQINCEINSLNEFKKLIKENEKNEH